MQSSTRRAALLGAAALTLSTRARAQAVPEITFGVVVSGDPEKLAARWAPFLDDMGKATGTKAKVFFAPDEASLVEAIRSGQVQLATLSNIGAITAVDSAGAAVFAQRTNLDTTTGYHSLLIVNKVSALQSLADVIAAPDRTLVLRNGDPRSLSGFLVPGFYAWFKNGVDLGKHFRKVVTGDDETNLQAMANDIADLATTNTVAYERFRDHQPERALTLREIWRSPLMPADPVLWRRDLPEGQKNAVRRFFEDYGASREGTSGTKELKVLAGLGNWYRFLPSSNRQLIPFRQLALYRERLEVEAKSGLSEHERAGKLREIDAKLADFERQTAGGG